MDLSQKSDSSRTIVICDDNQDILDMMQSFLMSEGYQVAQAHDDAELMPLLKRLRPALLILDIRMPEMDGFDIVETMKRARIDTPVFMVTAHDHFMYRNYAPVAGVREYFAKPVDFQELLGKIKEVVG